MRIKTINSQKYMQEKDDTPNQEIYLIKIPKRSMHILSTLSHDNKRKKNLFRFFFFSKVRSKALKDNKNLFAISQNFPLFFKFSKKIFFFFFLVFQR